MYHPLKYFFDRKIAIPKGMLEDCQPFPMPTRAYLENPEAETIHAPSKKKKVLKEKRRQMEESVAILDFETAAIIRDEIKYLEQSVEK